ncbi:MAG TPA: PPOX class F420-dependent oxidoreductase [Gaiellaceae bacterium]|jgi:PPOX class probable F420-dependent enzyme|nr:PPOX class F420-dependent oxidoreductase [Gaiellaceae bacterium]
MRRLTDAEAQLFLEPNFGWAATTRADGTPQLSVVWVDYDGENVVFNTAEGRAKPRNLRRNPYVSVAVYDRDDPYRWLTVEGTAELSHEGALEHINELQLKYRGRGPYPLPEGEQRVIVRVRPERVTSRI